MVERGLYPAIDVVIIGPVYAIGIDGLIPQLAYVVHPSGVGVGLDINLAMTPLRPAPGCADHVWDAISDFGVWAIDKGVDVKSLSIATFNDRNGIQSPAETRSELSECHSA